MYDKLQIVSPPSTVRRTLWRPVAQRIPPPALCAVEALVSDLSTAKGGDAQTAREIYDTAVRVTMHVAFLTVADRLARRSPHLVAPRQELDAEVGHGPIGADTLRTVHDVLAAALGDASPTDVTQASDDVEALGRVYEALLDYTAVRASVGTETTRTVRVTQGNERKATGAHYTPRAVTEPVVRRTLEPLVYIGPAEGLPQARWTLRTSAEILALRVCDLAMGTGAFLLQACRYLSARLLEAWTLESRAGTDQRPAHALRLVARRCLYGVDKNPVAVDIARRSLWLLAGDDTDALDFVHPALRCGDALLGHAPRDDAPWTAPPADAGPCFHWAAEFSEVFTAGAGKGFSAVVGNPPWVSYAGRAGHPIDPGLRRYYARHYASFGGYPNLQGLFVERALTLLSPGGRLGVVLPSSMAELQGYRPARATHDRLAVCDQELPDFGDDGFREVFQPAMALLSTMRAHPTPDAPGTAWPVRRRDLDAEALGILARMEGPPLPPTLFGERGLRTVPADREHLRDVEDTTHGFPLRTGSDIQAFQLGRPSIYADPTWYGPRLTEATRWADVTVLIRQTARVPIAVTTDGAAFRNSILAGFSDPNFPAGFLVAYLTSTPIRWWHYVRLRDARMGIPQVKIGHLRGIPAPRNTSTIAILAALGTTWSARNSGITVPEQSHLDQTVADDLALSHGDLARMHRDAAGWIPVSRKGPTTPARLRGRSAR